MLVFILLCHSKRHRGDVYCHISGDNSFKSIFYFVVKVIIRYLCGNLGNELN